MRVLLFKAVILIYPQEKNLEIAFIKNVLQPCQNKYYKINADIIN